MIDRTVVRTPWRDVVVLSGPTAQARPIVHSAWFADDGVPAADVGRANLNARKRQVPEITGALSGWLDGDLSAVDDIAVDLRGPAFHVAVWQALRSIPAGSVETYGEVAGRVGAPRAARAVGTACARNRVAIFVPCHRVVSAIGLGGYGWRPDLKAALLEHEGVDVERLERRRYPGSTSSRTARRRAVRPGPR